MKISTLLFVSMLMLSSCDGISDKNKLLVDELVRDESLIGSWRANPSYDSDSITLIRIDTLKGKIENIIRFNKTSQLDLFDIDNDNELYSCGNANRYYDNSNWNLDPKKGLLFLDIYGGSIQYNFHKKKSYKIESSKADSMTLVVFKTITDESEQLTSR